MPLERSRQLIDGVWKYLSAEQSDSGGGGSVPDLAQVLAAGADAGHAGITNLGATDMAGDPLTNLPDPVDDQDAATKKYVDDNGIPQGGPLTAELDADGQNIVNVASLTLAGSDNADFGGAKLENLDDPVADTDAVTLGWTKTHVGVVELANEPASSFLIVDNTGDVATANQAAFVNPGTATAAQIAQSLIDAGFMAAS